MKKLIIFATFLLTLSSGSMAAGGGDVHLEPAHISLSNKAAIQRGAKYFANYCMGCHSAKYVRYQLMTTVGLTEDQIKDNLVFDGSKVGSLMTIAMPEKDAAVWFGAPAPDLTLETRLRKGADWVYTYLKGFYSDSSRPMGVNNTLFKNVGMPNVLWELEGIKEAVYRYEIRQDGDIIASFDNEADAKAELAKHEGAKLEKAVDHLVQTQPGQLKPAEFDQMARDLATYMTYIAEPVKQERQRMGIWVVLFLSIFSLLAYLMKKEWWKDIH